MAETAVAAPSARARQIADVALELLEREGPQAVTMRAVAERVGIRAPSLYKHFPDKAAVEAVLTAQALEDLATAMEDAEAAATPGPTLEPIAQAYRRYALAHPHLYRLTVDQPLPRHLLPAGLEERAAGPLLRACGGEQDVARSAWAFAHGMVMLELVGRFPGDADLDAAWRTGCAAFEAHGPSR